LVGPGLDFETRIRAQRALSTYRVRARLQSCRKAVSAYAPELQPGAVVSTGRDYEEARKMIAEAIALYLEEMRNTGQAISPSPVRYEVVEVAS
jgi:predicted RNase H-like HicB family nuclease